jgi:hypothetical protein
MSLQLFIPFEKKPIKLKIKLVPTSTNINLHKKTSRLALYRTFTCEHADKYMVVTIPSPYAAMQHEDDAGPLIMC